MQCDATVTVPVQTSLCGIQAEKHRKVQNNEVNDLKFTDMILISQDRYVTHRRFTFGTAIPN
jgi:hypothetical protein